MKVLFMTADKYPPFRPAAKYLFGRELVNNGVLVDWLIQAEDTDVETGRLNIDGGVAYVARSLSGESRLSKVIKHLLDVINDLRVFPLAWRNRYDIIQVKDKYLGALVSLLAAKLSGAKFAYWIAFPHAEASSYTASKGLAKFRYFSYLRGIVYGFCLYKLIARYADIVFVQSEQMKTDMAAKGVEKSKMIAIQGSIDLDEIEEHLSIATIVPIPDRLIYVGTLDRARRLIFLVRVLILVRESVPTATLEFVGSGDHPLDEQVLHDEVEKLGQQDAVIFDGQQEFSAVIERIANAEICLSPYYPTPIYNSTSPTKLLEYMAVGRPVVGNVHPEQQTVIADSGCGLCPQWDIQEFADAILQLLHDKPGANDCGKRGREYVRAHRTHTVLGAKVLDAYQKLLSQ